MDNFSERIVKIYRSPYIGLSLASRGISRYTFSFFRPRKDGLKFIDARIYWVKLAEIFVEEIEFEEKKKKKGNICNDFQGIERYFM